MQSTNQSSVPRCGAAALAGALSLVLGSCASTAKASPGFATAEEAFAALANAARQDTLEPLEQLFGDDAEQILGSSDPVDLEREIDDFLELYDASHEIRSDGAGRAALVVGDNEWPYPIPAVFDGTAWRLDTEGGLEEIQTRRIGRNELAAIQVCRAVGDAQEEYRSLAPEGEARYAARFWSETGQRNGLHWQVSDGEPLSPLGPLLAQASLDGYQFTENQGPRPYYGYYYRLVETGQSPSKAREPRKGYCIFAWPAVYGESGVMSFAMDERGIVLESDLGPDSDARVRRMESLESGAGWAVCAEY